MACEGCNQTGSVILGFSQLVGGGDCQCTDCQGGSVVKSSCVYYGGPNLNNSGVETCDDLNTVLSKIDQALSATLGDYSTYNKYCLDDEAAILNEQSFVEKISEYVCTLRTDLDTFISSTYDTFSNSTNSRLNSLEGPGITCGVAGIADTDNINTIYQKLCTTLTTINSKFDLTGVDWDQCFVVSVPPTTLVQAFDLLIDQICLVKTTAETNSSVLPTFNNVGSCLPGLLTSTDSLVDTVNKLKSKVCTLPTFDHSLISTSCVTAGSNLQTYIQNIVTKVDALSQNTIVNVSSDFTLTPVNVGDSCQGFSLSLSASIADNKIAINPSDPNPGTFTEKFVAGSNISFDLVSQVGKVVINSTGGSGDNGLVKSDDTDTIPDYLIAKVEGGTEITTGLSISVSLNLAENKVTFTPVVDMVALINAQFDLIESNTTLKNRLCALVNSCPSPCAPPSNIQVIYGTPSTTTTSTTTTTAP